jgi:hypothetical protein
MNTSNQLRQSAAAVLALGIVVFSLTGLDSTLSPKAYAANTTTQTTAQA